MAVSRQPGTTHLLLVCLILLHLHILGLLLNLLSAVHVLLLLLHHVLLLLALVGSCPVHVVSRDAVIMVVVHGGVLVLVVVVVVADGAVDGLHLIRLTTQVVHGTLRLVQAVAVAAAAVLVTLQGTAYEDRQWEGMSSRD